MNAVNDDSLPVIPFYNVLELLGDSLNARLYKAAAKENPDKLFIIKILKRPINSKSQRQYFKQKIERLKIIHDARTITPQSFEDYHDVQFIVRPYFPGKPLSAFLAEQANSLTLNDFFHLAIQLTLGVNSIHEAGIIHGGIKPNNILIQAKTLAIRIVDFLNPVDIQEISHFIYDQGFVDGTLAYTSPEQTGRINHRVEFATDIYSLGIVFYQLLTGRLPFKSDDPLALIHSHLSEEAEPIHKVNTNIPIMLSRIVAKMCAKEPEKRYQTGGGLYADIQRCMDEYSQKQAIEPFILGLRDHTRRVIFISKMVGRDKEADVILNEYAKIIKGEGFQSAFISGLPGIGKTRLIQELQSPLVENEGYFTSGKFDQYQKNIPYSSLIQAFRNLIRTFLTESDERVAEWREKILAALGTQAKVITDVIPELTILLGDQADVIELPPVEARNRFNNLLSAFLASLSTKQNSLVLFIDDLQWCDSATFEFLQHIFANTQDYPNLFFIGAYRNNEVDSVHPLSFLLKLITEIGLKPKQLRIGALDQVACHEMVAYILDLPLQKTQHLAEFLAELTEGNPLFVSESLSWLNAEELLVFSEKGQWEWGMDKISHSNMPSTVVDMFGSKISQLDKKTLDIIKTCACMGNRFSAEEVALIHNIKLSDLFEYLKPVLTLGLFIESKIEFQFVHDRVQEAVLKLLSPKQRKGIHWKVAWHLLQDMTLDAGLEKQDNLFTIAAHLDLGCPKKITDEEALQVAKVNFHAGNKALNALATQAANEYYRAGLTLLTDDFWESQYALMYQLHKKLAKTELMCGRYEASEGLLNELLKRSVDDIDRAEALAEQTTSLSSIGNFIKAIDTANKGLAYFNKAIPNDDAEAQKRLALTLQEIASKSNDVWQDILEISFTEDRKSKVELVFYSELIPDLYMSGLVPQLYLSAAQSTLHCLEGGMDESVIYSFSIMGLNLGEQGQFEQAFRYQDLAHDLCAQYPDTFGATRGINGIVWCNMHTRSHPQEIVEYCRKGIQSGNNCGDLYNAGLSYGPLMWNLQVQGHDLSLIQSTANECLAFSQKNQLLFSVGLAEAMIEGWVEPMNNRAKEPSFMAEKLKIWKSQNHVASAGSYFLLLGTSHFYFGRYEEAAKNLETVQEFLTGMTDNVLKRQWYAFKILCGLLHDKQESNEIKQARLTPLLEQLEIWAEFGPLLKPYLALIKAEWQRYFSDSADTAMLYLQAIELAREQNYIFLDGFINERFALWLQEKEWVSYQQYLQQALECYRKCACVGKEIQLLENYADIFKYQQSNELVEVSEQDSGYTLPDLDMDYLIKSSLAISAETDQMKLLSKIMSVVLECSGAQAGCLLQLKEGEWVCGSDDAHDEQVPINQVPIICQGVVHYVSRTKESVVLVDALESEEFQHLPEVIEHSIRSLLCVPILRQTDMVGILYLENSLSPGVFTAAKVRMIELLSLQMAISIENAQLIAEIGDFNKELEQRVKEESEKSREKDHILIQQSKLATMGEMINNIAHQWRQPLNALGLLFGNLQDAQEFNELTTDYLNKQIENGFLYIDKMSDTINDFRDFFSPDKQRKVFSAKEAIDDAVQLVEASFKVHNIEITLDIPEDVEIYGILNEYAQVVLNLLTNAKDAIVMNSGKRVIAVSLKVIKEKVYLTVQDTGGGIDEDVLGHIFEPYFSSKEGGMGIGLYMSKMIVESSLQGYIEVCNESDGAKFSIVAPVLANNNEYQKNTSSHQ